MRGQEGEIWHVAELSVIWHFTDLTAVVHTTHAVRIYFEFKRVTKLSSWQ
jgi:hypothetical protein